MFTRFSNETLEGLWCRDTARSSSNERSVRTCTRREQKKACICDGHFRRSIIYSRKNRLEFQYSEKISFLVFSFPSLNPDFPHHQWLPLSLFVCLPKLPLHSRLHLFHPIPPCHPNSQEAQTGKLPASSLPGPTEPFPTPTSPQIHSRSFQSSSWRWQGRELTLGRFWFDQQRRGWEIKRKKPTFAMTTLSYPVWIQCWPYFDQDTLAYRSPTISSDPNISAVLWWFCAWGQELANL